jgi:autotransporter translocation and assembly factor TamB
MHVAYDAPNSTLTVTNSTFSSNQTNIIAAGTISDHSALSVRARTSDLQETDLLIVAARSVLSSSGKTAPAAAAPLNLHGSASLNAEIQGRIQAPRITGHAEADSLEIRQGRWPHIQADFEATESFDARQCECGMIRARSGILDHIERFGGGASGEVERLLRCAA